MANLEIVWKIIKENNFKLINPLNEDLTCLICKGIMINASNAPCGCRYCCQCIKKRLNGTDQNYCPGSNKYCGINLIDFDRDICIDRSINIRISQLTVKCPMETCEFTDELSMMEEHLKDCDRKFVGCPYSEIGCCKPEVRQNKVNEHLLKDSFPHNKLLVEYVNNLRKEIEELNTQMVKTKTENVCLIESLEKIKKNFKLEQSKFMKEIKAMKVHASSLDTEIVRLKQERTHGQDLEKLNLLEGRQEKIEESVENLHEANSTLNGTVGQLTNSLNLLKEEVDDLDNEMDNLTENISELKENVNGINKTNKSNEVQIDKTSVKLDNRVNKEFIWKLEDFSKVLENCENSATKMIFSDSFFISENGYKMSLYACPNGLGKSKGFFGLYFNVVRGPYDDILFWPCQIDVTLEIVNQITKMGQLSDTKLYKNLPNDFAYRKPRSERNDGNGFAYFVKLDYLLKQSQIIKNDLLFIKCFVRLNK